MAHFMNTVTFLFLFNDITSLVPFRLHLWAWHRCMASSAQAC